MRRRRTWMAFVPGVMLLLFMGDRLAMNAMHSHDGGGIGFELSEPTQRTSVRYWFPALRAFLFHVWSLRIESDIRFDRLGKALRHAREALAFAPDLPLARIELSNVLAWSLAAREYDASRRLAWMAEGLAVLDEGLRRDPFDAVLHNARGFLIWNRGETHPEFEEAFRSQYGRSTLDEGTDAMVRGAELSRGTRALIRHATLLLERRAETRLDLGLERGLQGGVESLRLARDDFAKMEDFLSRLLRNTPESESLREDADYSAASVEYCDLLLAGATGEEVSLERLGELERRRLVIPRTR